MDQFICLQALQVSFQVWPWRLISKKQLKNTITNKQEGPRALSCSPGEWLISRVELFVKFWLSASWGTILWKYVEFESVVQEKMPFKRFLISSSGSPPVWCRRTIYAILKEGIMGNIHVKLYGILTSGSKGDGVWIHFLSRALTAPMFSDPNHLCNFGRRYHEEQFCEIILNLDQWFRRKCPLKVFLIWISGSPFVPWSVTICAIECLTWDQGAAGFEPHWSLPCVFEQDTLILA